MRDHCENYEIPLTQCPQVSSLPFLMLFVSRAREERQLDRSEGYCYLRPCGSQRVRRGWAEEHRTGHWGLSLNSQDLLGLSFPICEGALLTGFILGSLCNQMVMGMKTQLLEG